MRRGGTTQDPRAASRCGSAHRPVPGDRRAEYASSTEQGSKRSSPASSYSPTAGCSRSLAAFRLAASTALKAAVRCSFSSVALRLVLPRECGASRRPPRRARSGRTTEAPPGPTRCIRCVGTTSAARAPDRAALDDRRCRNEADAIVRAHRPVPLAGSEVRGASSPTIRGAGTGLRVEEPALFTGGSGTERLVESRPLRKANGQLATAIV